MSGSSKFNYVSIPSIAPYATKDRYEKTKEVFKAVLNKLKTNLDIKQKYSVGDIGCANGEFLYAVSKQFPHWDLAGFDFEKKFIEVGKSFPGLAGVRLEFKDIFDINEQFDIVTCLGTAQIFADIEKLLTKLLGLCKNGGMVILDGLFNQYEVEVQTFFCDNSKPECRGIWQQDLNQHSRTRIKNFLEGKVKSFEFEKVVMGVEIPRNPDAPHTSVFTFRDADGRILITNGLNMLVDTTLLIIRK